jgi:hypothetical protein
MPLSGLSLPHRLWLPLPFSIWPHKNFILSSTITSFITAGADCQVKCNTLPPRRMPDFYGHSNLTELE